MARAKKIDYFYLFTFKKMDDGIQSTWIHIKESVEKQGTAMDKAQASARKLCWFLNAEYIDLKLSPRNGGSLNA